MAAHCVGDGFELPSASESPVWAVLCPVAVYADAGLLLLSASAELCLGPRNWSGCRTESFSGSFPAVLSAQERPEGIFRRRRGGLVFADRVGLGIRLAGAPRLCSSSIAP